MQIITEENKEKWNNYLMKFQQATIFHTLDWKNIIYKIYGFKPMYLINESESEFAIMTAFVIKNILSGRKITNMPYNFYSEPMYNSINACRNMIDFLIKYCKESKINCIELKSMIPFEQELITDFSIHESRPFINSILKIEGIDDYSTYNKNLSKNFRQNLRTYNNKSHREGILIKSCDSLAELDNFYNVLLKMYRDKHMMVCHPYSLYRTIFENLVPQSKANILIAKKDGMVLAGIVALMYNSKVHYSWAGNSNESYNLGLNYLLIESLIKISIDLGYKSIDFGSSPPSDERLLNFKEKWGCVHQPVYYYYLLKSQTLPDYSTSFAKLRKLYRYVPLKIIKSMMPLVVRQLA